jgi:hypothetical protein
MQEDKIIKIAEVCHEINKSYSEFINDYSIDSWDKTSQCLKESMISGVMFLLKNPEADPSDTHSAWLDYKEKKGWIYGPEKDYVNKTHPCIMPYNELPEKERIKDYLFQTIVKTLKNII